MTEKEVADILEMKINNVPQGFSVCFEDIYKKIIRNIRYEELRLANEQQACSEQLTLF